MHGVFAPQADSRRHMTQVNIHEAKTKLSQLLARVEAGEEIIIAWAGRGTGTPDGRACPPTAGLTSHHPGLRSISN
jgi:hypothetical protein